MWFDFIWRHWRGEVGLPRAFWINFVALFLGLIFLERFIFPPFLFGEVIVTATAVFYFVLVRLVIYPWQIVGVIRACERRIKNRDRHLWAIAAQAVVVLSFAASLAVGFASYQKLLGFQRSLNAPEVFARGYELELVGGNQLIHLRGGFEIGITRALESLLDANPQVTGIILDSDGGRIYEGRGLARVIRERGLATYSLTECVSSCTIAFVAGNKRRIADRARLGFHQYKNYSVLPEIDIETEQAKDRALFEAQGISPVFLARMFDQPPDGMWFPSTRELIAAGVVHETGFVLRRD